MADPKSITLEVKTLEPPQFRIGVAKTWPGDGEQSWVTLPAWRGAGYGWEIVSMSRKCLPEYGTMVMRYRRGVLNASKEYTPNQADFAGSYIRVDFRPDTESDWTCCWVGVVARTRETSDPGSAIPNGALEVHCADLLWSTSKWIIDKHIYVFNGSGTDEHVSAGCPSFNTMQNGRVIGNAEPYGGDTSFTTFADSFKCWAHTIPGNGVAWNDYQVLCAAFELGTPRDPGLSTFTKTGPATAPRFAENMPTGIQDILESSVRVYDVEPYKTTTWDIINRVADRRRCLGLLYFDWSETGGGGDDWSKITPKLGGASQFAEDVETSQGSISAATKKEWTLTGDHRNVDSVFQVSEDYSSQYDGVAVYGDPIRIMFTACGQDGTLEKRWSAGEANTFDALTETEARQNATKYDHIYRVCGLPFLWDMKVNDTRNSTNQDRTISVRTEVNSNIASYGALISGVSGSNDPDVTISSIRIDDDLPLQRGYNYATYPPTAYGSAEIPDTGFLPIQVYTIVDTSPNLGLVEAAETLSINIGRVGLSGIDLALQAGNELTAGRYLDDQVEFAKVAITMSVTLPNRPMSIKSRNQTGPKPGSRGSYKSIFIEGLAVWLADPNAIWGLDLDNATAAGYEPLREAGKVTRARKTNTWSGGSRNGTGNIAYGDNSAVSESSNTGPGILRDDTDQIVDQSVLAAEWYLRERRAATWGTNAFGRGAFEAYDESGSVTSYTYPAIGDLIGTLNAAGRAITLNTPVTSWEYSHESGSTIWVTSWSDRDWTIQ